MILLNIFGIGYDPETGKTYLDNEETPYTFEKQPHVSWPGPTQFYNPLQYASLETADAMQSFVQQVMDEAYPGSRVTRDDSQVFGTSAPMRLIVVTASNKSRAELNAGLIANSIIRSGKNFAKSLVKGDVSMAFMARKDDDE